MGMINHHVWVVSWVRPAGGFGYLLYATEDAAREAELHMKANPKYSLVGVQKEAVWND